MQSLLILLTGYHRLPQKGKKYMINLSNIQEKTVGDILLEWDEVDYVTTDQDLHEIVERSFHQDIRECLL